MAPPRVMRAACLTLSLAALAAAVLPGCGANAKPNSPGSGASPERQSNGAGTATATTPVQTTPAGSPQAARKLTLEADPSGQLRYNKSTLASPTRDVVIAFTNSSPVAHNVTVESASGKIVGATPTFQGGSKTLTLSGLAPGRYTFYCSVPGHRTAGMQGTLTVR